MISSRNNERIKEISKLQQKKYRDELNLFIAEGINLVEEAKLNGEVVETFEVGIDVTQEVMDKMASYPNNKVLSVVKKTNKTKISDKMLLLDNVQDPGNLGTLIRSAISFGFNTIVLDNCVDPYNPKCVRATEGAIFKINIIFANLKEFINNLSDYEIYGTSLKNGDPLSNIIFNNKVAIILGNEGKGVREELLNMTKKNIYIEMKNMESLNVSIAGSIIMYEVSK